MPGLEAGAGGVSSPISARDSVKRALFAVALLVGCEERAAPPLPPRAPLNHLSFRVAYEGEYVYVYELFDAEHGTRCWIARDHNGPAISCVPITSPVAAKP